MAIRLSLASAKKLALFIIAAIVATIYYFAAYFCCLLLIDLGFLPFSETGNMLSNPLAVKVSEIKDGNGAASAIAIATSSDRQDDFKVISTIVSLFSSASSTPSSSSEAAEAMGSTVASSSLSEPSSPSSAPVQPAAQEHKTIIIKSPLEQLVAKMSAERSTAGNAPQIMTPASSGQDSGTGTTPASSGQDSGTGTTPASSGQTSADKGGTTDYPVSFGSYFDTFSNSKYIDSSQSNLYYDEIAAAYFLPPDYAFEETDPNADLANKEAIEDMNLNDFQGNYVDKRCLNGNCLEQKGNDLSFNGKKLSLPLELSGSDIAAVSIGNLTKRWLVGVTIKKAGGYEGIAYYFDGQQFSRLQTPAPIESPYFGLMGFGGGENNFLLIYGASKGIAYHIQGDAVSDISRFFDFRVMGGGFKPEVIFSAFETNVNWYVYSSTVYHPVFIKLWQNQGADIAGEMVLSKLFQGNEEAAVFRLSRVEEGMITLLARIRDGSGDNWFYFRDRGFKDENGGSLVSLPIANDTNASLITISKIASSYLGIDSISADKVSFLFSADSRDWIKLDGSQNVDISVPATRYFLLKVIFPKFSDKFYSPFISEMLLNYYCRK